MIDRIVVAGLTDYEQGILDRLLQQLESKRPRNLTRSLYYDAKHVEKWLGSVIPARYYRLGLTMGWSAKSVDLLTRRCNLDGFTWADGDLESLGSDIVWRDNHLGAEVNQSLTASCKHATAFLAVSHGVEADGEPPVLVHGLEALNCTGLWNGRKRGLDAAVAVTERDDEGPTELTLFLPNLTIGAAKDRGRWAVTSRSEHYLGVPVEPLPYRPQLGRPFGASRISRPLMAAQNSATRTLIRMEAQSDAFSLPQLFLLGADASVFKNADGTPNGEFRSAVGTMLGIPDDQELLDEGNNLARAQVQQISAASPQPHIDTMRQMAQIAASETNVPEIYFGVSDKANPTSADALFIQDLPLINESEGAMDDWSPAIQRTQLRSLQALNGLEVVPDAWKSIRPKWRSAAYESRAAAADAGMKLASQVPGLAETEVGLEMLGMSSEQIVRFKAERRRTAGAEVLRNAAALARPVGVTDGAE